MDIFNALAEPTRRNIVELLASNGELSATAIYSKFKVSAPAISQHLKVLKEAKIVDVEKRAQQRVYFINPSAFLELEDWAKKMSRLWCERFDRLEEFLDREKKAKSLIKFKEKI